MLNTLRKGAAGWAAKILIGLLVLAFATWGIADILSPSRDSTLVTVGENKITHQDYQNYLSLLRNSRRFTAQQLRSPIIMNSIITQLTTQKLQETHAKDLQLGISDNQIIRTISESPYFRGLSGGFNDRAFQNYLNTINQSQSAFLHSQKVENIRQQVTSVFNNKLSPPDILLTAQYHFDNETRELRYFIIPEKTVGKIAPATEDEIKEYYKKTKTSFKTPEYRKFSYILLSPEAIKETLKVTPEMIKKYYKERRKNYVVEERRKILQLSFSDLKLADETYQDLKKGKKFLEIGKKLGLKKEDIELGIKRKDELLDSKIAEAVFALKKGEISKPIQGRLNTVIVKVTDIEPAKVTPLKKVEKEIIDRIKGEKASDKLPELQEAIEEARNDEPSLEKIAKQFKLKFQEISIDSNGLDTNGKVVPNITTFRKFTRNVFESDIGIENEPVEANNNIGWFDIIKIIPERTKKLDEVKDEIAKKLLADKTRKALKEKADAILKKLTDGEKLEQAAKNISAKIVKTKPLKRNETDKDLTAASIQQAFAIKKDQYGMAQIDRGQKRIIFQVTEVTPAKKLDDNKRKELVTQLQQNISTDIIEQYIRALETHYNTQRNEQAIRQLSGGGGVPRGSF